MVTLTCKDFNKKTSSQKEAKTFFRICKFSAESNRIYGPVLNYQFKDQEPFQNSSNRTFSFKKKAVLGYTVIHQFTDSYGNSMATFSKIEFYAIDESQR